MIGRLRAFGAFWYDFVVGDDWRVAVAVVIALGVTAVVARSGLPAWWVMPVAVGLVLPWSLWRARRTGRRSERRSA
ncbi:hypothetical protein ABZV93_00170 [Actinopolymorpha sp. NPDC004070]|uniref:hypothetical protein n=1 Tax=Actinopolymorpha sp. NPDC004070 TaxID=3154548 RepID=UPI0033B96985